MPVHDWTRVSAGTFHDLHNAWITHLRDALNGGLLPHGFYAQGEQYAGKIQTDVLTLHAGSDAVVPRGAGVAVLEESPPRVSHKVAASEAAFVRAARRTLVIRHVSGHRVVALLEVLSPANSDEVHVPPPDKPLTLASYLVGPLPEAYLEFVAVGDALPAMPLFLDLHAYINVPLESTYAAAYRGVPEVWRDVLEGRAAPAS